jgi:phosphoribosylaminoimidazolecarboxamide formyltransferase/IMP cyclohydrolase
LTFLCRYSIVSTGGTASSLEAAGVNVTKVEEITHFPEMVQIPDECF